MRRARRAAIAAGLALALDSQASPAAAAPPDADSRARAAESFREAQAAFERREFAAAAASFEAAAGFAPHPAALLSAADAWDRAGEPARAADDCDRARALAAGADAASADHVDYARDAAQCLARLQPRVGLLDVRGAGAAAARIDDGAPQVLPLRAWVRPGRHVITLVDLASSRSRREDVEVRPGEQRTIDLSAPAAPSPAAPPPAPAASIASLPAPSPSELPPPAAGHGGRRVPASAWIAFGVAAPAAIVYGIYAGLTVQAKGAYDSAPSAPARDTFYRDRTVADVAFTVGVAAIAAGLVLWWTSSPDAAGAAFASPGTLRF